MRGPYIFTGGKKIFHSDRNKRSEGNGKRLARLIKERMRDSRDMQINGIAPYTYTVEKGKISLRRYLVFSNGKIRFNAPAFPDIIAFCQTGFPYRRFLRPDRKTDILCPLPAELRSVTNKKTKA